MKKAVDADPSIKLIFLCSPGNPTGTLISLSSVRALLEYERFKGIVIVDEAYIDFATEGSSAAALIAEYANVCVLQTLSKSFGLAAIRCVGHLLSFCDYASSPNTHLSSSSRMGVALAQPPLIQILSNTKAPYNISTPTAHLAVRALSSSSISTMKSKVSALTASRASLLAALTDLAPLGLGPAIGAHDANFVLVPVLDRTGSKPDNARAQKVYKAMAEEEAVVVRYRGGEKGCAGCLRITIGSEEENNAVKDKLAKTLQRF